MKNKEMRTHLTPFECKTEIFKLVLAKKKPVFDNIDNIIKYTEELYHSTILYGDKSTHEQKNRIEILNYIFTYTDIEDIKNITEIMNRFENIKTKTSY
jgi:hypothetical protein